MKAEDLKSEADRDHANREEKRHRARTYKDRAISPVEKPPLCVSCGLYGGSCTCPKR